MIYIKEPDGFKTKFEVVSCFCRWNNKILLLKRQQTKPQGETWGVPAGKIDNSDASAGAAMERELAEETGIIRKDSELKYLGKVYVRYTDFDFGYHIFQTGFEDKPKVIIRAAEHQNYKWVTPAAAKKMRLIEDLDKCIELYYGK
jgi:8-oxo-dGTP pyrophosphatase MutT (NUDIX family)